MLMMHARGRVFQCCLKSIWVGELAQLQKKWHNCETKCTIAKKMAQLRNCTQESYKKLAQLQKKWHNCETKCICKKKSTTAKHIYCSCNNHFSLGGPYYRQTQIHKNITCEMYSCVCLRQCTKMDVQTVAVSVIFDFSGNKFESGENKFERESETIIFSM